MALPPPLPPIKRKPVNGQHTFDDPPMRGPGGEVSNWPQLRTAVQTFLNDNRAVFEAFARESDEPARLLADDSLAEAIQATTDLATEIARHATGSQTPEHAAVRAFRSVAASVVARQWTSAGLRNFDMKVVAEAMAEALSLVDDKLDRHLFRDVSFSDDGSFAMTRMGVAARLTTALSVYDFRRDRRELAGIMGSAVFDTAGRLAADILPESSGKERQTLVQTLCNALAAVMAESYERQARKVVAHLEPMQEADRVAFARDYDPVPEILQAFAEGANLFAAVAVASARTPADPRASGTPRHS